MKKIFAVLLSIVLIVPCIAVPAFAASSTYETVRSLYFSVDTSSIGAGMCPDEFDRNNILVECTNLADYPGLKVSVTDVQCLSSCTVFKVGDTAKFKFWVDISGNSTTSSLPYYVTSSTNVHVSNKDGTDGPKVKSVSKSRSGNYEIAVTVNTNVIKGQYTEPAEVQWNSSGSLGQATWLSPDDENGIGYYDVKLMRDGHTVYTQKQYNATSINLYPWMTKEGDYSFAVRTVPTSTTSGAKASEWAESDGQEVAKDKVSDGSGQNAATGTGSTGSTTKVGWQQVNNQWYYIYPDGTMKKNGWEKVQNKWYLFDASGVMLKGWQTHNNNTYYLDPDKGDMKTGWVKTNDGQWYYLNPNPNAGTEGAMVKNSFLDSNGNRFYLTSTGAMATGWTKIDGAQYYFKTNDGGPKGAMVTNQRVDGFWLGADGKWVQGQ